MPTSSQARIMSREDITDLQSIIPTRFHHQRGSSEDCLPAFLFRPSLGLSLPQISLYNSRRRAPGASVGDADTARPPGVSCPERLPTLESRVPNLICYPSKSQNGWFKNVSNNRPADTEREPSTGQKDKESPETASTVKPGPRKSVDEVSKQKRQSIQHARKGSRPAEHQRQSVAGPSQGKRKSTFGRKSTALQVLKVEEPDISDYAEPPQASINFEVNLLAGSYTSPMETSAVSPEAETEPEAAPEKRSRPIAFKSLYKQLLSIGMSANAFRGVTVMTKEGEVKNATEEEAGEALDVLASGMVDTGTDDQEESEEEEEEVELLMGSLLSDVGTKMSLIKFGEEPEQQKESVPETSSEPARPEIVVKTASSEPLATPEEPLETPEESLETPVDSVPPTTPAVSPTLTTVPTPLPLSVMEHIVAVPTTGIPAPPKTRPEPSEEEKAFLQSVTAGSVYKTSSDARKPSPQPHPVEKPKKKVYKLPPMRLRRTLPPADAQLLCIRTPNVDLTHEQVKNMLEAQLGNIVSLQHDPEYLQNGDVQLLPRVMWIFKMEDTTESNYTKICMDVIVGYDGETLRIRKRDDVFREENRAYMLVKQIKDEQARRMKNRNKMRKAKPASSNIGVHQQASKIRT